MKPSETIEISKAELMKAFDAAVDEADRNIEKPTTKYCKYCSQTKSIKEFGLRSSSKDGFQFYCRKCCREISRDSRLRNEKVRKEVIAKIMAAGDASGRLKVCKSCQKQKPFTEFRTRKGHGKYFHCRECERAWDKARGNIRGWRKIATQVNSMGTI